MRKLRIILPLAFALTIGAFYGMLFNKVEGAFAMPNDNKLFHTDMYFGYSFDGEGDQIHIFASRGDIEEYIVTLIESQPDLRMMIEEFFSKYDAGFFADNKLIIAIVDRGSGRLSFEVESVTVVNGVFQIGVNRLIPAIQTMDYRQWVMVLPVDGDLAFSSVNITMRDIELNSR